MILNDAGHWGAYGEYLSYLPSPFGLTDAECLAKAEAYGWFIAKFQLLTGHAPLNVSIFFLLYLICGTDDTQYTIDLDFIAHFDRRRALLIQGLLDAYRSGHIPSPTSFLSQ